MRNKIFINDEGMLEQVFAGRQTFKKVVKTAGAAMILRDKLQKEKRKIKTLVDLTGITTVSADAIVAAADSMKTSVPTKTALYGGNKIVQGLAGLLIAATGREKDIMIFESRQEALKWLGK